MKILTTTKTKFFIGCIVTCLTLTACDDAEEEPQTVTLIPVNTEKQINAQEVDSMLNDVSAETAQPTNETATVEELQIQPIKPKSTDNKAIASSADSNVLAVSLSKGLATGFNYQLIHNKQWTENEKECFGRIKNDFAVTELEKILKTELNEDEFQQATEFYQSSVGKQLEQWRDIHIDEVIKNNNIAVKNMNFTEKNLAKVSDFMGSSANIKINQLVKSPQIEQLVAQKISPQLFACGMAEKD